MTSATRVALLGAAGYGRIHLDRLARLGGEGRVELVGVADPAGPSEEVPPGTAMFADLEELLRAVTPDVVVVSTPIHTHAPLAIAAMEAGADVYVEKPPAAGLDAFDEMLAVQRRTGRVCQVGFQSLGSRGLERITELVAAGEIGDVLRHQARGLWQRNRAYYRRSAWAGRRRNGDVVIADGVTTNPLSHAVATALRIAGLEDRADISAITTELYRAHAIEGDDTSFIRIEPMAVDGAARPVVAALTLCAPENGGAFVDVVGDRGRLTFHYTKDVLDIVDADGGTRSEQLDRVDLFENLLAHRDDPSVELLSPLERSGGFTAVLQAVLDAPAPTPVAEPAVTWVGDGDDAHPVLTGIDRWVPAAAESGRGYAGVGAPWAASSAVTRHDLT